MPRRHRAPTICPEPGCANDQPCPNHTREPWAHRDQRRTSALTGSRRQKRNATILQRDRGICHVCGQPGATEVDHVTPIEEGGTDTADNLAAIHAEPCHKAKTAAEAARARRRAAG